MFTCFHYVSFEDIKAPLKSRNASGRAGTILDPLVDSSQIIYIWNFASQHHLRDLDVDTRLILKWTFKQVVRMWTGFGTGTSCVEGRGFSF